MIINKDLISEVTTTEKGLMSANDKAKLNNIGMTRLWSGSATSVKLDSSYSNYDLLLILNQSSYNRNSYIIISKYQFGQNKNFSVVNNQGDYYQVNTNASNLPTINIGDGVGRITEVIGIRLG